MFPSRLPCVGPQARRGATCGALLAGPYRPITALRRRSSSSASGTLAFDRDKVEALISCGQVALRRIRWRISGLLIASGTVLGIVELAYETNRNIYLQERDCHDYSWRLHLGVFCVGMSWTVRFILFNLAPLADDVRVTQLVLVIDSGFVAFDGWRRWWHLYPESPFLCAVYTMSSFFMICGYLWVAMWVSPERKQAWMWRVLTVGVLYIFASSLWRTLYTFVVYRCLFPSAWLALIAISFLKVYLNADTREAILARLHKCVQWHSSNRAAAGIAGLVGNCPPHCVYQQATARFRCVQLQSLCLDDIRASTPDRRLYLLSSPVKLGRCDAFISHSWHDDADAKWAALRDWCEDFKKSHDGREPKLWFDKCCIDQNDIQANLQCLPLFLRGCRRLVVLCGRTYCERLWCIIEVFTYLHVGGSKKYFETIRLLRPGFEEEDDGFIDEAFMNFDVGKCMCVDARDYDRMMVIIKAAFGSLAAFNERLREVMPRVSRLATASTSCSDDGSDSSDESADSDADCKLNASSASDSADSATTTSGE